MVKIKIEQTKLRFSIVNLFLLFLVIFRYILIICFFVFDSIMKTETHLIFISKQSQHGIFNFAEVQEARAPAPPGQVHGAADGRGLSRFFPTRKQDEAGL